MLYCPSRKGIDDYIALGENSTTVYKGNSDESVAFNAKVTQMVGLGLGSGCGASERGTSVLAVGLGQIG